MEYVSVSKYLKKPRESVNKGENCKISGARYIAEMFSRYEVTHVFFVEAILRYALVEMEALGIQRVMTHTEKAAAYMADGYSRISHKPSICMAQSVGAANLASGLQDAYLALSPVIAITGRKSSFFEHRNAYQEIPHNLLFQSVTKYSASIETIEQLPYKLRQAFRESTSGAPGPVHLDLVDHVGDMIAKSEGCLEMAIEDSFSHYPAIRFEPDAHYMIEAVDVLKKAERPVIIAGGGVIASSAGPEIVALGESLNIPVATSLNGKGAILSNHPLNVGVVGSYSHSCANRVVSEADLVIFVGSHTGDQVTYNWKLPKQHTPVIQIDIDPAELGRNYPNVVPLLGDAKFVLTRLNELIRNHSSSVKKHDWTERAKQMVKEWHEEWEPLRNSTDVPIRTERLCKEITDFLPSNGILVSDTGFAGIWTGTMCYLTHEEQSYLRCAGSLGWAFPAALGAKCAAPDRPVVCFTGDGGFWYHLSELETASRYNINTITVVNNNSCLKQCWEGVKKAYDGRKGNWDELINFKEVSFAKIAEDMGCIGITVEAPEEIMGALKKALILNRPVVIDVKVDVHCEAPAPWSP